MNFNHIYQHKTVKEEHRDRKGHHGDQCDKGIWTTFNFCVEMVVTGQHNADNPDEDPEGTQHETPCSQWDFETKMVECGKFGAHLIPFG